MNPPLIAAALLIEAVALWFIYVGSTEPAGGTGMVLIGEGVIMAFIGVAVVGVAL